MHSNIFNKFVHLFIVFHDEWSLFLAIPEIELAINLFYDSTKGGKLFYASFALLESTYF
jgi:hypothetical protein